MDKRNEVNEPCQILVVEDDREVSDLLNEVVGDMGYKPLEARNVPKALDILQEEEVNLMLLDLYLQGKNGVDLLKLMHKRGVEVPTVVVSAFISNTVARQLIDLGVQGMVTKPFKIGRVIDEIQKLIQQERDGAADEPGAEPLGSAPADPDGDRTYQQEGDADPEDERRRTRRVRMDLPVRAKLDSGRCLNMDLVDISSTGMQTLSKDLSMLENGPDSTVHRLEFEIPAVARLAWINARPDGTFAVGWEFE